MRAQEPEKAPRGTARQPTTARADAGPVPVHPGGMSPREVFALQRTAGNAAVARLVQESRHRHGAGCGHPQPDAPVQRSAVHEVLGSGGRPLDEGTRTEMEGRLGADFSDVRVHEGAAAQRSAAEIGARAYTSGSHVVIGSGGGDKHTLAHELTHVIQQRQGPVSGTENGGGLSVSDPSDRFERAAEANATRVMSGPAPAPRESEGPGPGSGHAHTDQPVQRRFKALFGGGKAEAVAPPLEQVQVGDRVIPMRRENGFYEFEHQGRTVFIHDLAVQNGVVDPGLAALITQFLGGGMMLYRGIPRWHPTWHQLNETGEVPPLGAGRLPNFDTRETSFIPFAPTQTVALGAAVSRTGMGDGDEARFVEGYDQTDPENVLGQMVTVFAQPGQNDVAFFNETEVQVRGPVQMVARQVFTMSTPLSEVYGPEMGDEPLSSMSALNPSAAEIAEYEEEHGSLRR
ncbi:DUF4157 domain-containing protein [Streptomyces sp. NPDC088557]|uniref:eCIS core domain-containing protein n=1 Tax=Streptomyces sp. NPDC088557 TaxID=3365867 RepID=UPI00382DD270